VSRLSFACVALAAGNAAARAADYTTPGLSAEQLAKLPGVSYARPLQELPQRNLVVVHLTFPPKGSASPQQGCSAHRHPGPASVRVTKGAVRLGLEGQPVQLVRAGQTFYEPANALHVIAENASSTERATAYAVLAIPKGAPILVPDSRCGVRAAH
jgi:quercetin dioxygenase-like cupin family protein